ncbi:MAG: hypothetical protein M1818_004739 [Claussenomyces sp. TS43310]|nr:MAG: hypothetical protein M1818_004739 [Claussenomyces sp. TS43310]
MKSAQVLVAEALALRDASLAAIEPPLVGIPDKIPNNVCSVADDVLTPDEINITSYDVPILLRLMRDKELSCEAVTRAFLRRAALAQKLTNCITELLPQRAIERAQYLDSLDEPVGPLHGLPISVKEHHGMAGCTTHCSYVKFIGKPQVGEVSLNEVLWKAGAVFYARTTQPQAVMHLETSSNIYGVTTNPHNTNLTSGGSSGGESALIGFRGSVLIFKGVGGDIGGSIRNPAACTGVYGFKPTTFRIGKTGGLMAFNGQEGIISTQGPLSTSRSGLNLFMESYLSYEPWIKDDYLAPIPWRPVTLPPRLKIAIMWSDGIVIPHPPITRALKEVARSLADAGIELVDWVPEGHDECWDITQALYFEDGGQTMEQTVLDGGEVLLPLTKWLVKDNENVRYRTVEEVCAVSLLLYFSPAQEILIQSNANSILKQLKVRRNMYRLRYNNLWLSTGQTDGHPVDAILCPAAPGAAPEHGNSKYWSYTSQWNLLDYPGAVFPVSAVNPKFDLPNKDYVPLNEKDRLNYSLYEPSRYVDAPIGLQLVTRRFEDEKCLAILEVVEKAMGRE